MKFGIKILLITLIVNVTNNMKVVMLLLKRKEVGKIKRTKDFVHNSVAASATVLYLSTKIKKRTQGIGMK